MYVPGSSLVVFAIVPHTCCSVDFFFSLFSLCCAICGSTKQCQQSVNILRYFGFYRVQQLHTAVSISRTATKHIFF